jgi:hypothetical protein
MTQKNIRDLFEKMLMQQFKNTFDHICKQLFQLLIGLDNLQSRFMLNRLKEKNEPPFLS